MNQEKTIELLMQEFLDLGILDTVNSGYIKAGLNKAFVSGFDECFDKSKNGRRIVQMTLTGIELVTYNSIVQASKITGICRRSINHVVSNQRKTAGGYKWKEEIL